MKPIHKNLLITAITSIGIGAFAILPVVFSDNGYVAGFVFFPLLLLIGIVAFILFFAGLVTVTKKIGPFLLLSSILLPSGFVVAGIISKQLELGSYREQPMRPIAAPIANKVLFKKEASHEKIEMFWTDIIGYPTDDRGGHWSRPGVSGGFRPGDENGYEVIVFSFRPEATEEEKNDVRERIKNYPPVYQFLENVDTTPVETPKLEADNSNTKKAVNVAPREPNTFKTVQ